MTEQTQRDTRPARFEQEVTLTVRFVFTGEAGQFEETERQRLQMAAEQGVQRFMPPVLLDATIDIRAKSLPGSNRYLYPEEAAKQPLRKGDIVVTLDEALAR